MPYSLSRKPNANVKSRISAAGNALGKGSDELACHRQSPDKEKAAQNRGDVRLLLTALFGIAFFAGCFRRTISPLDLPIAAIHFKLSTSSS